MDLVEGLVQARRKPVRPELSPMKPDLQEYDSLLEAAE